MKFQQLAFVMEIVRCGSINKASTELFTSQSNISNSVKELEKELGIKIFNRNNKGIEITDKGREFISYITPLIEQKKKIENLYKEGEIKPVLSFNVSSQRYPFIVEAFLNFLEKRQADRYNVHMKETDMYQVIDDVFNNKCDIGIIFLTEVSEKFILKVLKTKGIEYNNIIGVKPQVFIRKTHPFANKRSIDINDLYDYPYVVFGQEKGMAQDYSEEGELIDFQRALKTIYIHDRATAYNIIANTDAFSIGTGIIPNGYSDNRIITVPIKGSPMTMNIGWIKLKARKNTSEMFEFINILDRLLKENYI